MSYTPPYGNSVDFSQVAGGYSAPLGNAVNFYWVPDVPTVSINCRSTVAFYGRWLAESVFSFQSSSLGSFSQPYRSFAIPGSSTFNAGTDIRDISISSGSSLVLRPGSIARFVSASQAAPVGQGRLDTAYAINSGSAVSANDFSTHSVRFNQLYSRSVAKFAGAFNADVAMRVAGRSAFRPKASPIKRSSFSMLSGATFQLNGEDATNSAAGKTRAAFAISARSIVSGRSAWTHRTGYAVPGSQSRAAFAGTFNKNMAMKISGASTLEIATSPLKKSVFLCGSGSAVEIRGRRVEASTFSVASGSGVSNSSRAWASSSFVINCSASVSSQSQFVRGGSASIVGASVLYAISDFDFSEVAAPYPDVDVVFCFPKQLVVHAVSR